MEYIKTGNVISGVFKSFALEMTSKPGVKMVFPGEVNNKIERCHNCKVFPLPVVEKTYTAVEVGARYGVSANRVGRIANAHGMKTKEFGMYVMDKAPNSMKDIETFRYNERGMEKIGEYLRTEG